MKILPSSHWLLFTLAVSFPVSLHDLNISNVENEPSISLGLSPQFLPDDNQVRAQSGLNDIELPAAWDITQGSSNVIIAVIDDAFDMSHPDLRDNLLPGWDFVDGDNDPSPGQCVDPATQESKEETHGTKVAGIIGAVGNNQIGIAGVNWYSRILPIRIGCNYSPFLEAQAVEYAISQGAHIINASYSGPDFLYRNQNVINALAQAGNQVLFVTAAGNAHTDNNRFPVYPGNAPLTNIVSVASSNASRQLSHWSQYGSYSVDIAAPGENLLTTFYDTGGVNAYGQVSGTSFSSALVSGVAGLVRANGADVSDIKGILLASGSPLNNQTGYLRTDTLLNAKTALQMMDSPRPVLIIDDVMLDDSNSDWNNQKIDPLETFTLNVSVQNLWESATNVTLELLSSNRLVQPVTNSITEPFWEKNSRKSFSFQFVSEDFSGLVSFPFVLKISGTGSQQNISYARRFTFESGMLSHNQVLSDTIQRHSGDEIRAWHFNIPPEAERVAIEIERPVSDSRRLGLLASRNQPPLMYFKQRGGKSYTSQSEFELYSDKSYERLDFNVPRLINETIHLEIFNQPANDSNENVAANKKYHIKACYFTPLDSNRPPEIDAGPNRKVKAGEEVVIEGSFSDPDGQIVKTWWDSISNIEFTVVSDTQIRFIAPESGPVSFVLTAIDNDCAISSDTVSFEIEEENSGRTGLQLTPGRILVEEGSAISVQVTASYLGVPVSNLNFISGPDGLIYEKALGQSSFDKISWRETDTAGIYVVIFSANIDGSVQEGRIIIEIVKRGGKTTGGGCTSGPTNVFDPTFFFLLFASIFVIRRKHHPR